MIFAWLFAIRAAIAASYATIGVCDPHVAGRLAPWFGLLVVVVCLYDLWARWRPVTP